MSRSFNLADLFEIVADTLPDQTALVTSDGEGGRDDGRATKLTYRELDQRATRVAHHLSSAGVRPGDHVAILAHNRTEWLEAQIGAWKLRAVPVNVNYRYTAGELAYLIGDSASVALVGERSLLARLGAARDDLSTLRHVLLIEDAPAGASPGRPEVPFTTVPYEEALAASPVRDFGPRSSDDLYLLYTGGTTGLPKGVMWRCEDIFMSAMFGGNVFGDPVSEPEGLADLAAAGGGLTTMVCAPMMHGAGMWVAWLALLSGGTLVLWSGRTFEPGRVLSVAEQEKAQAMLLVGDAMARPLADWLGANPAVRDLSSLVSLATGGSVTSPDVKSRLLESIPSLLMVLDAFGGSETGASGQAVQPAADGSPRIRPRSADVAVLDESLRPIPPGSDEIGVMARTGRIPIGYWNDEEKTAQTFVTDREGRRWALQGDMAKVDDDGSIILLGRGSLVINTGGEKVFVEEVEAALKSHPGIYDALVVGLPDDRLGSKVAAVVSLTGEGDLPGAGSASAGDELRAHCRETLAGFKVPREIDIVDAVRRSPAGKADYQWARRRLTGDGT